MGGQQILNAGSFIQAWEMVRKDGRFLSHDWVVKVDADAVFFPERLRSKLKMVAPKPGITPNLYIKNCENKKDGLYGALEVLSRPAVQAYFAAQDNCKRTLEWQQWGEDQWISQCLGQAKVGFVDVFGMLEDEYCGEAASTCSSDSVAFHPFNSIDNYLNCLDEAGWDKLPKWDKSQ